MGGGHLGRAANRNVISTVHSLSLSLYIYIASVFIYRYIYILHIFIALMFKQSGVHLFVDLLMYIEMYVYSSFNYIIYIYLLLIYRLIYAFISLIST